MNLEQMFDEVLYQGVKTTKVPAFVNGTSATAGGAEAISIGASDLVGVYFGSGLPTVSAGKGSFYLRTDGSGTTTRAYINTDGGTTWTNLTAAA